MQLTDLLSPFAGRWLRRVQSDLDLVPHPEDVPRRIVAGPDTDRVLLLGNGPAIGFGVRSHELALPGQLVTRLAPRTGRGALVDVSARRGVRASAGLALAREGRLTTYDAIIVSIGATDAASMAGPAHWRDELGRLLDGLRTAASPFTALLVLPISPLQRTGTADTGTRRLVDAHTRRLDAITAEVCAERAGVDFLPQSDDAEAPRSPSDYGVLADRIADVLVPRLDLLAHHPSNAGARVQRRGPDPEVLRQAALDRSGLVGTGSNAVLDRLLQSARDLFAASAAAVTLIDGDRVVYKAVSGMPGTPVPRSIAPCNRAIRQDGSLVIPDLEGEPIAAEGARFYAGHALESPDGYRIGTLCILDHRPRRPGDADEVALVELAARVQAELWREVLEGERFDGAAGLTDTGSLRLPVLPVAAVRTAD